MQDHAQLELLIKTPEGELRCLGIPLASAGSPLELDAEELVTFGFDAGIEFFPAHVGAVSQVATLPFTVGVWVRDYRLEAGIGVAGAGCPETKCLVQDEDWRIAYSTGFTAQAGVGRTLFETGAFGLGLSVRYRMWTLPADTFDGHEYRWAQGPVLAPVIAALLTEYEDRTFGGSREGLIGLELPVGYAFADNGERTFTAGFAVRSFFTAL